MKMQENLLCFSTREWVLCRPDCSGKHAEMHPIFIYEKHEKWQKNGKFEKDWQPAIGCQWQSVIWEQRI